MKNRSITLNETAEAISSLNDIGETASLVNIRKQLGNRGSYATIKKHQMLLLTKEEVDLFSYVEEFVRLYRERQIHEQSRIINLENELLKAHKLIDKLKLDLSEVRIRK